MKIPVRFNKISVERIFVEHFKTLVNNNTNRASIDDWVTFFVFPIAGGGLLVWLKHDISANSINLIITSLSIFVGLLINVLVLIFSLIQKENEKELKIILLKETITNISYTILISIATIIIAFVALFDNQILKLIASFVVYSLTTHFFITLLMIVKRMYSLFINEVADSRVDNGDG